MTSCTNGSLTLGQGSAKVGCNHTHQIQPLPYLYGSLKLILTLLAWPAKGGQQRTDSTLLLCPLLRTPCMLFPGLCVGPPWLRVEANMAVVIMMPVMVIAGWWDGCARGRDGLLLCCCYETPHLSLPGLPAAENTSQ